MLRAGCCGGGGPAAGITVGAPPAQQMLGSDDLSGLPTALFTLGSAPAALVIGRTTHRVGLPLSKKHGARPAIGGARCLTRPGSDGGRHDARSDHHRPRRRRTVRQEDIDTSAELTGDEQWFYTGSGPARTRPFGATVQHGLLVLGLATGLLYSIFTVCGFGVVFRHYA